MTIYRLIEVEGVITPAIGLTEKIIDSIDTSHPKLIVLAGVAGSGKTLTANAVKDKLLADGTINAKNIHELGSINNQEETSVKYANETLFLVDEVDNKQPMKLVIWDEVRYDSAETAAIARLLNLGYNVIALSQDVGRYNNLPNPAFKKHIEFNLA